MASFLHFATMRLKQIDWRQLTLAVAGIVALVCGLEGYSEEGPPVDATDFAISDESSTPNLGERVYVAECASCHGLEGRGDGDAAYLLNPKPRDFVMAEYRLVSTWDGLPTDEDLLDAIDRGMPGSAMPGWGHLSEATRMALLSYIKSFSGSLLEIEYDSQSGQDEETGPIMLPPEPAYTSEARARAVSLFDSACAGCHGATGRGDGTQAQINNRGYPTRPRDLTRGIFKGRSSPESVYRRIVAGMPGTPMPMNDWSHGDDAWHLVHYVLEMSTEEVRARNEMIKQTVVAPRVPQLPDHPQARLWQEAEPVAVNLMPLWWRDDRPESVEVRALHDGQEMVVLMRWADDTHDYSTIRPQDFRDAAAVQFSLTPDPPFFGMGEQLRDVNIWMWKADREGDLKSSFQDIETAFPHVSADSYPNFSKPPAGQPVGSVSTLDSDPTFISGWGAGNIVSDPTFNHGAEDLTARGLGTLRARPRIDQTVEAEGVFGMRVYSVMFRRALKPNGEESVGLRPGEIVPVAFAVWDGSAGDRDGRKSVTIWQDLVISK